MSSEELKSKTNSENDQLEVVVVLCLHGNRQNSDSFQQYCSAIERKAEKNNVKMVFLNALYPMLIANAVDYPTNPPRQWWPTVLNTEDIGIVKWDDEMKAVSAEALLAIDQAIANTGATILLGFSQGGNAAVTYMEEYRNPQITGVVCCNGYRFVRDISDNTADSVLVDAALLNVTSAEDDIVPDHLAPQNFRCVEQLQHDKGHRMVTRASDSQLIIDFCRMYGIVVSVNIA